MDISLCMIEAILFDLDDLMVNSAPLHMEASRRVFGRLGANVDQIPAKEIGTYFGKRVTEILRQMVGYFGLDKKVDVDEINREREEIFLNLARDKIEPMPGLFELINLLRSFDVKKAVASSGTGVYIRAILKKFDLEGFFHAVSSGDMVKHGKPHPDIFLKAAELLGVNPARCVVIEDSACGVEAAKRAGMYCIGVRNAISPYKQDLSEADFVVDSLDQIDAELLNKFK